MPTSKQLESIIIKGANIHNLKNVDVEIPHDKLVVITGVSGSGKSSLAIDTLYAEGQRRYVESLSSYARQFLMRMNKPEVDSITGVRPAIAVEQKASTRNTRSTVGTMTELYDYLRLLYARIGITYSPHSGQQVVKHEVQDVVDFIMSQKLGAQIEVLVPFNSHKEVKKEMEVLLQKGYNRLVVNGEVMKIEAALDKKNISFTDLYILINLPLIIIQVILSLK